MLRVRTGPKALRAIGGSFFKLWDSKEKLNSQKTLRAVHKTKGLRNFREEPAIPAGGRSRVEGKGANSAPEKPPPPTLQTGPRFLSKDFLRPDRRRALGLWRKKAHRIRGECAQASGCLSCSDRGRHKTQVQRNPRCCGGPENWNRTQRRARSI